MFKLAYVNDYRYLKYDGDIYSSGCMTSAVWERFSAHFDEITVYSSIRDASFDEIKNSNKVSHPKVKFIHVDYIEEHSQFLINLFQKNKVFLKGFVSVDAVIARVPGQYAQNAVRCAVHLNKPVGLEVVGCPFDSYWNHGRISGKVIAPLMYLSMRKTVRKGQYLVYVTEQFLQNRYPSSAVVINASNVDIEVDADSVLVKRKKRLSSYPNSTIRIGLMGSMGVRYKGHKELLAALSIIKEKIPKFRIEFVGGGDPDWCLRLATKLGLENNITVIGRLAAGDQVINWLDTIDLYVHPSLQEGLPRSLIEAMSRGCPALASSIAGIPELLDDQFLHNPKDTKMLAQQLEEVLTQPGKMIEMAERNVYKSLSYRKEKLDKKRIDFWGEFSSSIKNEKKIVLMATVPMTLNLILAGQPRYLSESLNVTIITSPGPGFSGIHEREGVPVIGIKMHRGINLYRDVLSLFKAIRVISEIKPHLIHTYTPKAGLIGMLAAFLVGVPIRIHTFTGLIFPTQTGLKKLFLKQVDRLICYCATRVIPESLGVRDALIKEKITHKPLNLIGYGNIAGVDTDYFNPDIFSNEKLSRQEFHFIFIGRLHRDKGIKELVGAIQKIDAPIRLTLVGDLDEEGLLDDETLNYVSTSKKVVWQGFQQDVRPYLAAADVLILPSYREGFPNVLLQAGAMELPCIVTDISGSNEIIEQERNGWIVPAKDQQALFFAMKNCLSVDRTILAEMGKFARKKVNLYYERKSHWARMRSFYQELIDHEKSI